MALFNFNLITPPPNDELVNEITQLNDNWDELELKLNYFQGTGPVPSSFEIGSEVYANNRHMVWTGTAWSSPVSIGQSWTVWNGIDAQAPFTVRPGLPFKYRSQPNVRKVQLTGGMVNTGSANPWPKGVWNVINSTQIPAAFAPVGGVHIQHSATSALPGAPVGSDVAAARIRVTGNGSAPVLVEVHWMGADGGGNFVQVDGVEWYF